ncbi:LysR substrate-binding domain-containing protein [Streptomyces sp. NPDC001817]|uniref:LysR substrate-binding domain-containing protein n=1 Tax=Streptomyces sp. NPDC001817 TaxID=3154398 RepID=UPI003330CBC7
MRGVFLYEETRVAAVPRHWALAERDELAWGGELADWPLIVNTVSGVTFPHMWPAERRPVVGAECSNYDEWLEKVAAGLGIGTAPEDSTRRYRHPRYGSSPCATPPQSACTWPTPHTVLTLRRRGSPRPCGTT